MKKEHIKRIFSSLILIPLTLFFIIKGSLFFIFFLSVFFLITVYEWVKMSKKKIHAIFGMFFLTISFLSAFFLRGTSIAELKIFILTILICIATDIGGFVFGNMFGGPKLTKISPNKTYSGMVGGYFLSVISVLFYITQYHLNYWNDIQLLTIILLISSVSQIGDLIISYFKRISKIKNTGKLIPGHGGVLDRIDGMLFAIPFAFLLFEFI